MGKKIVIFQFRSGELVQAERKSFCSRLGSKEDQCIFIDVLNIKKETLPAISDIGGIIIGGSGDNSLVNEHAWFNELAKFIEVAKDHDIPMLGVCFGHQFLAKLHGATIASDLNQKELGTIKVQLTEAGKKSPLFKNVENNFYTIAAHNDSVVNLPSDIIVLASNSTCKVQAFQLMGKEIYGVEFHPEISSNDFKKRITVYQDFFVDHHMSLDEILERGSHPTTDQQILKNFMSIILEYKMQNCIACLVHKNGAA